MHLGSFQKVFRTGLLIVALFAMLGLAIFGGSQVSTFLARANQCQAQSVSAAQVTPNSAVISWSTEAVSQGSVEYGTTSTNLAFKNPEGTSGKTHNVPLTLLTPNTVYYYIVSIGNTKCDSTGQTCSGNDCVPWSFTTAAVQTQNQLVITNTPVPTAAPTIAPTRVSSASATPVVSISGAPSVTGTVSGSPAPTSGLSAFCTKVKTNIGASSQDTALWPTLKQYGIDGNNVVNGLDVIKCEAEGR